MSAYATIREAVEAFYRTYGCGTYSGLVALRCVGSDTGRRYAVVPVLPDVNEVLVAGAGIDEMDRALHALVGGSIYDDGGVAHA